MVKLSERLQNVCELITPGLNVADIGCDHGYLSIYLIENNIAKSVIASDVRKGPLEKATENISLHNLNNVIDIRLSDGLKAYNPGEVESVVMAGMGGNLMIDIMENGRAVLEKAKEVVLQPQSDISRVRHYLKDNGYMIISEAMVYEDYKFYPMMKAVHGDNTWDKEIFFTYGKILLREQNPVLHQFLLQERDFYVNLYSELSCTDPTQSVVDRLRDVEKSLALNDEALMMIEEKNMAETDRTLI